MSKYSPLGDYLRKQNSAEIPMTFGEIERITGQKLPPKSQSNRAWWSNSPSNNVMTKVWLDAGYRTEQVDIEGRKLVFRRDAGGRVSRSNDQHAGGGMSEQPQPFISAPLTARRHPIFGALKGTFTIEPGYDLTQPAMPEWADLIDEKYGKEMGS